MQGKANLKRKKSKMKVYRISWIRSVKEFCSGCVEAENVKEAIKEFKSGIITDFIFEDGFVESEKIIQIKEEKLK